MKRIIIAAILATTGLTSVALAAPNANDVVNPDTEYSQEVCTAVAKKYSANPFKLNDIDLAIYQQCIYRSMSATMSRQYKNPNLNTRKVVLQDAE